MRSEQQDYWRLLSIIYQCIYNPYVQNLVLSYFTIVFRLWYGSQWQRLHFAVFDHGNKSSSIMTGPMVSVVILLTNTGGRYLLPPENFETDPRSLDRPPWRFGYCTPVQFFRRGFIRLRSKELNRIRVSYMHRRIPNKGGIVNRPPDDFSNYTGVQYLRRLLRAC